MLIAERVFCLREEFSSSLCVYWMQEGSEQLSFLHADGSKLSVVDLLGQIWLDFRCIQFLRVPGEEE